MIPISREVIMQEVTRNNTTPPPWEVACPLQGYPQNCGILTYPGACLYLCTQGLGSLSDKIEMPPNKIAEKSICYTVADRIRTRY